MARRTRSLREMREMAEAAERLGLNQPEPRERKAPSEPIEPRSRARNQPVMRVVWAVCDAAGRTVATYDYPRKAEAEAHAAQIIAKGKGHHFVRSVKEPMPR